MTEIVTMSSKGQIVVPKNIREQLDIGAGSSFAVFGKDDTLILKKVKVPSAEEVFQNVHKWGSSLARQKGWKEKDLMKRIHKGRGTKSA
ncbi:MAG: AbrB/MazE/SpoVT family DNA-binding domain-containing protein [Nanoarchaeota archaeon]|nr:AbrB/MazE/SpoVT family DNA-binding domain-containing protein [Nanoarchaeota archaeon]